MRMLFIAVQNALFAGAKRVSRIGVDPRVSVLWREFMAALAMSFACIVTPFAEAQHAALKSLSRCANVASNALTYPALSLDAITTISQYQVVPAKFMPPLANDFLRVLGRWPYSTHGVLACFDCLHMRRIDASTVAAKMIDLFALWYRANEVLIRQAMGSAMFITKLHSRIAVTIQHPRPNPTSGFWVNRDALAESIF